MNYLFVMMAFYAQSCCPNGAVYYYTPYNTLVSPGAVYYYTPYNTVQVQPQAPPPKEIYIDIHYDYPIHTKQYKSMKYNGSVIQVPEINGKLPIKISEREVPGRWAIQRSFYYNVQRVAPIESTKDIPKPLPPLSLPSDEKIPATKGMGPAPTMLRPSQMEGKSVISPYYGK